MKLLNTTELMNMARHVFRRSRGIPDKRLMHPRREWGIGLLMFAAVLGVGSVYSAQSFTQFKDLTSIKGEASLAIPRYNQGQVEAVLALYAARNEAYQDLISDTSLATQFTTDADSRIDGQVNDTGATTTASVPIQAAFPEKIVYGDNLELIDVPSITAHCAAEGGTLNECGSVCPATAEVCTQQCAYTCEF